MSLVFQLNDVWTQDIFMMMQKKYSLCKKKGGGDFETETF